MRYPASSASGLPGRLLNLAGFQAGWLACVLGAAAGIPWLGPLAGSVILAANALAADSFLRSLSFYLMVALAGWGVDACLGWSGALIFEGFGPGGLLPPPWLPVLWALLATTLDSSLAWMRTRPVVAALLGLLGGPAAYMAGESLGAVDLGRPLARSMLLIASVWAAVMPLLSLGGRPSPGRKRAGE